MQACINLRSRPGISRASSRRPRRVTTGERVPAGFTLLEMVVALSVFIIIIAGVFSISKGTMELSADMSEAQERSMIRQNFIEFLRESFRRLPGEAEVTLEMSASRGTYVPSIGVFNGGDAFSPGAAIPPDASVELYADEMPGGLLRVGLRLYDADETSQRRNALGLAPKRRKPGPNDQVLPLIERVAKFEWNFYNPQTQKWENNWKQGGRPMFAELQFALDDGQVSRSVFWIPPIMKRTPMGVPGTPAVGADGQPLANGVIPPVTPGVQPQANAVGNSGAGR
ncbi:MAG: Type secretory pathway, component PulJ [Verrucomicrobiaceae bacterium]|nr:Type secretory pathway, component PulJ [Verrucomicrobiaceae bacterium]